MGKNLFKAFGLAVLVAGLTLPAVQTVADEGQFYIVIGGQRIDFDDKWQAEEDSSYFGGFGYDFTDNWSGEINVAKINLDTAFGDDNLRQTRLDFTYRFNNSFNDGAITPYFVTGIGNNQFSSDEMTFLSAGLGLLVRLNDSFEWRTAIRTMYGLDDPTNDYGLETGLVFRFGKSRAPVAVVAPTPAPAPAPVAAVGDQDGDGVPDNRDACPDTPRTHRVDERGCSITVEEVERIELTVQFDFDQAVVKQEYLADIRRVADFLRANPGTTANLEGHTDSVGEEAYNQGLSQRRVDAVRQVLISQFGIEASRVTGRGFGESQPVASNATAEGRALNRRVVSIIAATLQRPQTR